MTSIGAGYDVDYDDDFSPIYKLKDGYELVNGKPIPIFSYDELTKDIDNLKGFFNDKNIDSDEYKKIISLGDKLVEYREWTTSNLDSTDPDIKAKC